MGKPPNADLEESPKDSSGPRVELTANEVKPELVQWDGVDDKENVRNVSKLRKWIWALILVSVSTELTALSSVWGNANAQLMDEYDSSLTVTELGLSLYVLGMGIGPLVTAPLSEFYGRKLLYLSGWIIFFAFQFLTAFAPNVYAAFIGRLLTALGGSLFMSNVPGSMADLFEPSEMALPIAIFALGPFFGPGIGSILSGFIIQHAGVKWVFYVFIMWSFGEGILLLLVPETYSPVLLLKKAKRLRKQTGDDRLRAPYELESRSLVHALRHHVSTPVKLLVYEPMVLLLCVYNGFLLSVIYLFFVAYPMVFREIYDFSIQFVGLAYVSISLGMVVAAFLTPAWSRLYNYHVKKAKGVTQPEFRLPQVIMGSFMMVVGLFGFAWTVYPSVHFMVPIIFASFFGMGAYQAGTGIQAYLVEAYRDYAASATAACVFVRCAMAAGSPLYGTPLLNRLGFHWGVTLLAFLAVLFAPCPVIFFIYGEKIRLKSKFASVS